MKTSRSGFTLLEVMLSVVILAIMAGGVFASVRAVVSAVDSLQVEEERQMTREAFVELIRKNLAKLPPRSILLLEPRESDGGFLSEVTFENAPAAFSWGKRSGFSGWIVLGLAKGSDGLLEFRIQRIDPDETARSSGPVQQLTLAKGLRVLRWEFFDDHDRRWVEFWDNRARRPNLVRLNFQFQGDLTPSQVTFSLPWTTAKNASIAGN
jgi:prepilin-type N-terminal cleavage/methylation domain-containing protein